MVFCLVVQFVGRGFEPVFGAHQRAVQFVVGNLQIGQTVLIGRLHFLISGDPWR